MKKIKRIAVFGGTFSPIHYGHIEAAKAYASEVKPDALYIIPTAVPPHKMRSDLVSNEDRFNMLKLAFSGVDIQCDVVISDIEFKRGGKSYTIDTVNELLKIAEEVYIYCGTDMLLSIDKWYEFEKLLSCVSVAYMGREDDCRFETELSEKARELSEKYGTMVIALPPLSKEMSSSEIREKICEGQDLSEYIPLDVIDYIKRKQLYKNER